MALKVGDGPLTTAFLAVAASGVALTAGGAVLRGQVGAVSVGMGVLTAVANLYVLSRIVAALAIPHVDAAKNAAFAWGVIALGKIMVLFGGIWLLMAHRLVDPIPLLVGYGSLPIGIAIGAVVSDKTGPRSST